MILVTGSSGQLGTALGSLIPEARLLTRHDLDLSRPESIRASLEVHTPDAVLNCAAYTAVDRAEEEEELAHIVNAAAVAELASFAADRDIPLVTFSTDYVFDGRGERSYLESDPTDPINAYGRTKRDGEELAMAAHPGTLVVRTSWVISGTHPNFIATILRRGRQGDLRVVDDQRGCPTVADDLARATLDALDKNVTGVLHLTNQGETTWYRLAQRALELAGMDTSTLQPCRTEDFPTKAARPRFSVLGSERREELEFPPLPHWEDSLPEVVSQLLTWI